MFNIAARIINNSNQTENYNIFTFTPQRHLQERLTGVRSSATLILNLSHRSSVLRKQQTIP